MARVSNQSCSIVMKNQLLFDTQMKTALWWLLSYSSYHQISYAQDQISEKRQIDKCVTCRHVQAMVPLIVGALETKTISKNGLLFRLQNFFSNFSVAWVSIANNCYSTQVRLSQCIEFLRTNCGPIFEKKILTEYWRELVICKKTENEL